MMEPYKQGMAEEMGEVVAKSHVLMDGARLSCWVKECNMGKM